MCVFSQRTFPDSISDIGYVENQIKGKGKLTQLALPLNGRIIRQDMNYISLCICSSKTT